MRRELNSLNVRTRGSPVLPSPCPSPLEAPSRITNPWKSYALHARGGLSREGSHEKVTNNGIMLVLWINGTTIRRIR